MCYKYIFYNRKFKITVGVNHLWRSVYIHNWSLETFSQDYDLVSHTTYVVCNNFIRERQDLQFNVDSGRQIFHGKFIYSQSFCHKSAENKSPKIYLYNTLSTRPRRLPQFFSLTSIFFLYLYIVVIIVVW